MKKLAIIGCGGIGTYHLGHFMEYRDVELAGFCDLIPERAEKFAETAGCGRAFTDYREMYDAVKPDMVFICIPPTCHGEIELETIHRGIHFFVEKPLSLDLDLARRIRDAAEAAGIITASGFQCRYSNIVQPTVDFIRTHEIPYVECARMGGIPDTPWWLKKSLSGGQAVEQTIHQFDIIRYVFGEPEEVFSMATRGFVKGVEGYDTDDLSTTIVKFQNGALGTISTGCYAENGACFDSKITFSAKDARLDHYIIGKVNIYGEKPAPANDSGLVVKGDGTMRGDGADVSTILDDGTAGVVCDRTFVDAVLTGDASKIKSPYRDAFRSVSFTLACNKSMETGLPVRVELD